MAKRRYYTLVERHNGCWGAGFGDYDKETVLDEKDSILEDYTGMKPSDLKIISTGASQKDITAAVDVLNRKTNTCKRKK